MWNMWKDNHNRKIKLLDSAFASKLCSSTSNREERSCLLSRGANISTNEGENAMEKTECCSSNGHTGNESHLWGNCGVSSLCPGNHFQRSTYHTAMKETKSRHHCRQAIVGSSLFKNTKDGFLNIKITSTFSLNPELSTSSFHGKELLLSSGNPQQTSIEFERAGSNTSSCFPSPVLQQQHQQIKRVVLENTSLSNEKSNNTKADKIREIGSKNLHDVWNDSVANKGETQPLKNILCSGVANHCNISTATGRQSVSPRQNCIRKIPELLMTPMKQKLATNKATPGAAAQHLIGRAKIKKPNNFKKVYSKQTFPNVQLLLTPAPETFKDLEIRLGFENDEEPVVTVPNYFLDFNPEFRPHDPSIPKLVDASQPTGEICPVTSQFRFPSHKANSSKSRSEGNVINEDKYGKQTNVDNTPTRKRTTMETNTVCAVKPTVFLEKSPDIRHVPLNGHDGPKSDPAVQVSAGVLHPSVYKTPLPDNSLSDRTDVAVPLKMTSDTKTGQACPSLRCISEFGNLSPHSNEAISKRFKSQSMVSNSKSTESLRCFSKGSNSKGTQKRINCTVLQQDRVTPMEDESSFKISTSNERETSITDEITIPEQITSKPTDTVNVENFFFYSSAHALMNACPKYGLTSSCTPTSAVVHNSTTTSSPDTRKYECEVCGRAFSRSNTLITHTRIHTGDRPFSCDVCGRAFRQLGNLTRHKLTHTATKPHACPICKKCFSRTSNLNTHMRTHTNYKPFVCDFCGKGFHQKVDMKIHRYTHTGEKPHKCNKCGRGFKQLTHLKYHMRTHSAVRLYKCEHCGKGFNQKGNLQAHTYGHTGNRPYRCDICGKGFTLTSTLNTHKRTHAPLKPFKCKFCEKAFYQQNALKTHYISYHPYTDGVCLL